MIHIKSIEDIAKVSNPFIAEVLATQISLLLKIPGYDIENDGYPIVFENDKDSVEDNEVWKAEEWDHVSYVGYLNLFIVLITWSDTLTSQYYISDDAILSPRLLERLLGHFTHLH